MGLRELLILVLILAIVGVILRGLYVALKARRGQLRMALEKNIPQYDPEELSLSELPNGGARMVERSFAEVVRQNSEFSSRDRLHKGRSEHAIPVLMDTVSDGDDDVGAVRTAPSAVAGARQAARHRHGIKSGSVRPPQKPTHRPIDRMAERQQSVAAAAVAAVVEAPRQEAPVYSHAAHADETPYLDPLDSHVFSTDNGTVAFADDLPALQVAAPAAESFTPEAADAADKEAAEEYEERAEFDDEIFEEYFESEHAADKEFEDEDLDEEYEAESFESVYVDDEQDDDNQDDVDDLDEADDQESDDPLAARFEDDLDDEDDTLQDDDPDETDVAVTEEYRYETDFGNGTDESDDDQVGEEPGDYYADDEEDEVVEQKTGPRRWLQWAGEKLSGMTAAAADEGERDRARGAEEQARARAEMNAKAARTASKADTKPATKSRTERTEPVFNSTFDPDFEETAFDDALLDDSQNDVQDHRSFNTPTPAPRKQIEPLDRSRQSELNLDEPEDLVTRQAPRKPETSHNEPTRKESAPRKESRPVAAADSKSQSKSQAKEGPREQQSDADAVPEYSEVLVVNVVAKPEREFAGIDLLPVLLTSGLRFGDMSIFHRHIEADTRSPVLFSVANIVNPGTFDLNQISEFSTRGLCFFMTLPNVANSMQAFDKMLDVAQQVRIALDGDLKDDNRSVMTAQTIEHYRQRVRDFDLRQLRQPK
ncbi:MAG: cell division protein ZipA [Pseudomonadota bacterium]